MKNADKNLPTVGFAMLSYNDEKLIEECLKSIFSQNYPKNKIKVIFADGGSTDRTLEIAKKYGVQIIFRPDLINKAYKRGELAAQALNTDLQMTFSMDNRLQEKNCLKKMVDTLNDSEIVGVETFRYGYSKSDPILSRYFALIGGVDPIAIGLGKADRGPYDTERWHSFGGVKDKKNYFEITFDSDVSKIPTLGANGFIVRRKALKFVGSFKNSLHIDTCARLIETGYNKFAFVKNFHVIHYIDMPVLAFLKRRILWANAYSPNNMKRSYSVYCSKDWYRLLWIILTYTTIIFPLIRAIRGYIKKPDFAWFLHVYICPAFVLGYGLMLMRRIYGRIKVR